MKTGEVPQRTPVCVNERLSVFRWVLGRPSWRRMRTKDWNERNKRAEWSLTASLANSPEQFICPSVWSCSEWWRDESYIHTHRGHTLTLTRLHTVMPRLKISTASGALQNQREDKNIPSTKKQNAINVHLHHSGSTGRSHRSRLVFKSSKTQQNRKGCRDRNTFLGV